ncbi:MAG: hypothetical protein ABID67_02240 [Candidatus Nealsonbacteria bacterium]
MKKKILIFGKGRIGTAVAWYLKKLKVSSEIVFFTKEKDLNYFDIFVSALPGDASLKAISLALKYGKNLIDISDLETEEYLKREKQIKKKSILLVPGAGFCPGLVNFILGKELVKKGKNIDVEVKVGTVSNKKNYFPFLWCFEDLIWQHDNPSLQLISGKKVKFLPFEGFKKETLFNIPCETYFEDGGFEYLIKKFNIKNFTTKVIRPEGFMSFFLFLKSHGFFSKLEIERTKNNLERKKGDDITLGEIFIKLENKIKIWKLKVESKEGEKLNSMQKITAIFPAVLIKFIDDIKETGLLFPEDLAKNEKLFNAISKEIKKEKILV